MVPSPLRLRKHRPIVLANWDDALRLGAPGGDRALRLAGLAEDKPEEDVDAAKREETERGDKCGVVNVMGEDLHQDEALDKEAQMCTEYEGVLWSKKAIGQLHSESRIYHA